MWWLCVQPNCLTQNSPDSYPWDRNSLGNFSASLKEGGKDATLPVSSGGIRTGGQPCRVVASCGLEESRCAVPKSCEHTARSPTLPTRHKVDLTQEQSSRAQEAGSRQEMLIWRQDPGLTASWSAWGA